MCPRSESLAISAYLKPRIELARMGPDRCWSWSRFVLESASLWLLLDLWLDWSDEKWLLARVQVVLHESLRTVLAKMQRCRMSSMVCERCREIGSRLNWRKRIDCHIEKGVVALMGVAPGS